MVSQPEHPLDNVVWNALIDKHSHFAWGNKRALRYPSAIAPFVALIDTSPASFKSLREILLPHEQLALVTPSKLPARGGFSIDREVKLIQMTWAGDPSALLPQKHIKLSAVDVRDMISLAAITQPGPFGRKTIELGNYVGIRRDGELIAMAGERMQLPGYTEISAVCVKPAFRGQGLAVALMQPLIMATLARNEIPFLHVLETNLNARLLYQKMGFIERCEMHLTVLEKKLVQHDELKRYVN